MPHVEGDAVKTKVESEHSDWSDVVQIGEECWSFVVVLADGKEHTPKEDCNEDLKGETCLVKEDNPLPKLPWRVEVSFIFLHEVVSISCCYAFDESNCE